MARIGAKTQRRSEEPCHNACRLLLADGLWDTFCAGSTPQAVPMAVAATLLAKLTRSMEKRNGVTREEAKTEILRAASDFIDLALVYDEAVVEDYVEDGEPNGTAK